MPTPSPESFLFLVLIMFGAISLLYIGVRLVKYVHLLSMRLCRPQYEWLQSGARRWLCCVWGKTTTTVTTTREDTTIDYFDHASGTLAELSFTSSEELSGGGFVGVHDREDAADDAKEEKQALDAGQSQESHARV